MRAGSDTQAVEETAFVRLAGCRVACDDARHVRSVAVLVRRVRQRSVVKKFVHATRQIRMHGLRVAVVQAGVGHGDFDAGPVEAKLLCYRARAGSTVISAHDLGGNLIDQLWLGLWFNPQDCIGPGQGSQLRGCHLTLENIAKAEFRLAP